MEEGGKYIGVKVRKTQRNYLQKRQGNKGVNIEMFSSSTYIIKNLFTLF